LFAAGNSSEPEAIAMTLRNILVPIFPNVGFDGQLAAALNIARQVEAHINAVFIRPDPAQTLALIPELATTPGFTLEAIDAEGKAIAAAAEAAFVKWRTRHELASGIVDRSLRTPYACWSERIGAIEPILVRRGRLSDLIINLPDPMIAATESAFDAAVFESGRPAILVPKKIPENLLRHVLIAWNGSLEATRAIAGAMTLLHEAEKVSVFVTPCDADGADADLDLSDFLTWHGIRADYSEPPTGGNSIGPALLDMASARDATLLVMGAYTHSRVRQMLLGGVTRHVLQHAELPVLMMH
jgi:nucleotide-binding universal stress UspA family protein